MTTLTHIGVIFDTRTMLLTFGLFGIFIGLLFVYYMVANGRYSWRLVTFTIGKFFQGIAVIGLSSNAWLPDYFSLHVSNAFLLLGYTLEVYNVATFDKQPNKALLWGVSIPTLLGVIFVLSFAQLPYHDLIEIHHLIVSICFGLGAFYLFAQAGKAKFVVLVAVTYTLFALAFLNSSVSAFVQDENLMVFEGSTIREALLYFFAGLNLIMGSVGYLLILKDLDEQKIAFDNLKLAELNAKKNKFFSIIAHDLKGPISGVMNIGEILQNRHKDLPEKKKRELFELLVNSTKETTNLLENLLKWSQSESKTLDVKPAPLYVDQMVENSLSLLKQRIEDKNISVETRIKKSTKVWADENMIDVVFRNLISNATKYVLSDGTIKITCKESQEDQMATVNISDDGVGIEKGVLKKLFEIDSGHSTKGTNKESGTGLGLKICKEFVVANGGTMDVVSEPNKGSTFSVSLPVVNGASNN